MRENEEKMLIFQNHAMKFYNGIIKNFTEFIKFGMVKIIEEMFYFGFKVKELRMPSICDENSSKFIRTYTEWKLEVSKTQGSSKASSRVSGIIEDANRTKEMIKEAYLLLMRNVRLIFLLDF